MKGGINKRNVYEAHDLTVCRSAPFKPFEGEERFPSGPIQTAGIRFLSPFEEFSPSVDGNLQLSIDKERLQFLLTSARFNASNSPSASSSEISASQP